VTAFFSVAPKAGGFALLLRFTLGLLPGELGGTTAPWTLLFALMAAASMTLGNLSAMPQTSVKRLLAYSSIAHAGYALLGVAAGGSDGTRAVLVYFATYLPMSLGAFVVVMAVEAAVGDTLDGWRGLGKRAPFAAAAMAIFLFSLTGLPPFAGFFGKFYVFAALLARGGGLMLTLAVIGVVNSAASLYFYARVLKAMYLEPAGDAAPLRVDPLRRAILAILALPTLGLFAIWSELAGLVDASLSRW
jgi:NADH-quinone oxidoreductase subunit N